MLAALAFGFSIARQYLSMSRHHVSAWAHIASSISTVHPPENVADQCFLVIFVQPHGGAVG